VAGDTDRLAGWPVTVGVVEVGVVDTRYGVSQPGADAERNRCACLHCTPGLAGRGDRYQCGLDWGRSSRSSARYYTMHGSRLVNTGVQHGCHFGQPCSRAVFTESRALVHNTREHGRRHGA